MVGNYKGRVQDPDNKPHKHLLLHRIVSMLANEEENVIPTDDSFGMNFHTSQPFAGSQTFTTSKNSRNEKIQQISKKFGPGRTLICSSEPKRGAECRGVRCKQSPLATTG